MVVWHRQKVSEVSVLFSTSVLWTWMCFRLKSENIGLNIMTNSRKCHLSRAAKQTLGVTSYLFTPKVPDLHLNRK